MFGNTHIPCGCESRKEIMFTHGMLGPVEYGLIAVSILSILIAWRLRNA